MDGIQFVFLDRDGVINRKPAEGDYVANWEQFVFLPGAIQAIAQLNRSGRIVIVVTNQRGIALGRYSALQVDAMHAQFRAELAEHGAHVDAIYFCPHDKDECDCRKPKTGLFEQAFRDFPESNSANSVLIGDSISDIEAGLRLQMRAYFVRGDETTRKPGAEEAEQLAGAAFDSLAEAVSCLF